MKNDNLKTESNNNNVLLAVLLKYICLFIFGTIISSGFLTIVKNYDIALRNDLGVNFSLLGCWTIICICNGYLEYKRSEN